MRKLNFFFRIYLRNLFHNRRFTWVNIFGLSMGVVVSLLILVYVRFETSFDSFNTNVDKIYRIMIRNLQDGTVRAAAPLPLSDVLKKDFPQVENVIGLMSAWQEITVGDKRFDNLKGGIVEKDFFPLFGFPLIEGNQNTLFEGPYEAVMTSETSRKLFGNTDPLGRTFEYDGHQFTVTGVINNIPSNSVFTYDFFLSGQFRHTYYPDLAERWYVTGLYAFVTFRGNTMPGDFEKQLSTLEDSYYPDFMKHRFTYVVTRFKGSHLNPNIAGDLVAGVSPSYLWILSAIALGILVIACLNFMNISIARADKKRVETAIKKVTGASSGRLVLDFFIELGFIILITLIISCFLVSLLLPWFNSLTGKNIFIDISDPVIWFGLGGFIILTLLLSGLYPSIVLAMPSPANVFLRKSRLGNKLTFQKSFVVLQFTISIALAISQLFVLRQISFMINHDTGFDKTDLITIPVSSLSTQSEERLTKTNLFVQAIEKYQARFGYGEATVTEFVPGFGFRNNFKIFPGTGADAQGLELLSCDVDENFAEVYGIKVLQGRYFSKDNPTDIDALIMNEAAFKKVNWDNIDGKTVGLFTSDYRKKVIGVVNDINVRSLQYPVSPMIFQFGPHHNYPGYISLRLDPAKKAGAIAFFRDTWDELFPGIPFSFESLDEKYKAAYGGEKKLSDITGIFTILAILLSLMGIFALSTLEAEKRIKEIGLRRINGAGITEIVRMLNTDFLKWIAIAFVLACPVAWYFVHKWIMTFAFRTELRWWLFVITGLLLALIAVFTISWQSLRAATRNPVEALRYE